MEKFLETKRKPTEIFQGNTFLLFTQDDTSDLQERITSHGGQVASYDSAGSDTIGIVPPDTIPDDMPVAILRRLKACISSEWIKECIQKQKRVAYHTYDRTSQFQQVDSTPHHRPEDSERNKPDEPAAKRQKVEQKEILKPVIRPWEVLDQSLHILDTRSLTNSSSQTIKIASFDLDGTLITTKSGKKFATDTKDWKWWHPSIVQSKLTQLVRDDYQLVLFSNQNGVASGKLTIDDMQNKVQSIVESLDLPILVFLAVHDDIYRKPRPGSWTAMEQKIQKDKGKNEIDVKSSFYCGDAAGRPKIAGRPKDFAATDYKFALNLGLPFYTPEAFFLDSKQRIHSSPNMWDVGVDPRTLTRPASGFSTPTSSSMEKEEIEIVVLSGPPASGKSHFAATRLQSYTIVSQDELGSVPKCKKACEKALQDGHSVVIDSTNRDVRARAQWIQLAKDHNVHVRCFEMDVEKPLSMHLNKYRMVTQAKKIPDVAIHSFYKNFTSPQTSEGFSEVVKVPFCPDETNWTKEEKQLFYSYL